MDLLWILALGSGYGWVSGRAAGDIRARQGNIFDVEPIIEEVIDYSAGSKLVE
jgi:hypothetical protein